MHAVGRFAAHLSLQQEERELLRLGGLLHDIGQYPLSHCIELAYRAMGDSSQTAALIENPEALATINTDMSLLQRISKMQPSAGQAKDKAIGSKIVLERTEITSLLSELGEKDSTFI